MNTRHFCMIFLTFLLPSFALADDRLVRFYAPDELVETGLVKFFAPRFSLKTQVKIDLVGDPAAADVVLGAQGRPIFHGLDQTWHVSAPSAGHPGTDRLVTWLASDVGLRTIHGFAPDGVTIFGPPEVKETVAVAVEVGEDAILGHEVSRTKCTRCHTVDDKTRMSGIGSTPSFSVLRSLPDWDIRFASFYVLNPHPSFTQIEDVTDPFPIDRPSPIAPIELTLDELEAILAYVESMTGANLGGDLIHQ